MLRWEYRPGSTLYVVWQQDRLNDEPMTDFEARRALASLFDGDGQTNNVFAIKFSYWINP